MINRFHDDHACRAGVAERIMMLERDTQVFRDDIEPMAGEFGPSALGNPDAIEPCCLEHCAIIDAACCCEGALVKIGMGHGRAAIQMGLEDAVNVSETGLAQHVAGSNPVDPRVEAAEMILRIDKGLILKRDSAIAKANNSDLAYAADTRTCRLDIDDYELWFFGIATSCIYRGVGRVVGEKGLEHIMIIRSAQTVAQGPWRTIFDAHWLFISHADIDEDRLSNPTLCFGRREAGRWHKISRFVLEK
jgi:hypothetical protein